MALFLVPDDLITISTMFLFQTKKKNHLANSTFSLSISTFCLNLLYQECLGSE